MAVRTIACLPAVVGAADGTLSTTGYFQYSIDLPHSRRTSVGSFDAYVTGLGR